MNELKFNSQVCTTIEQSRKLLDLGLKPETADMSHEYIEAEWDWFIFPYDWNHCTMNEYLIPAWSMHRLMEIYLSHFGDASLKFNSKLNPYEFFISDMEQMIDDGFFNKKYLNR